MRFQVSAVASGLHHSTHRPERTAAVDFRQHIAKSTDIRVTVIALTTKLGPQWL